MLKFTSLVERNIVVLNYENAIRDMRNFCIDLNVIKMLIGNLKKNNFFKTYRFFN